MELNTVNWRDPRHQRRLFKAISWAKGYAGYSLEHVFNIHSHELTEVLGHQGRPVSAALRANMLRWIEPHKLHARSTGYKFRWDRIANLTTMLPSDQQVELFGSELASSSNPYVTITRARWLKELTGEKDLEYTYKDGRYYHPLINLERRHKALIFAGHLDHVYDIDAAAPNIMLNYAMSLGVDIERYPELVAYVTDKQLWRGNLAKAAKITVEQAKEIHQVIFNLGWHTPFKHRSFQSHFDGDTTKWNNVKAQLSYTRKELKKFWAEVLKARYKAIGDNVSLKDRFQVYFEQEGLVMDELLSNLKYRYPELRVLREHDGFRVNQPLNIGELRQIVYQRLGYNLTFKKG